uniref:Uncharacterized protein n=1 Tax=Cannabis sativa TaxID=3483 RepID=A0A803NJZ2_CANSA
MLDVCGVSKDVLLLVKEHLQDLQFTLRRLSIGELTTDIENKISDYNCYRKKLKKETINCLNSLKGSLNKVVLLVPSSLSSLNDNLSIVVDVLKEVRVTTISIVESLFSLIDKPWLDQIKSAKASSFLGYNSKFKRVSNYSSEDIYDSMELHSANKRLVAVKITIECIEKMRYYLTTRRWWLADAISGGGEPAVAAKDVGDRSGEADGMGFRILKGEAEGMGFL